MSHCGINSTARLYIYCKKPHADPLGSRHFCLHVPDIHAARTYLTGLGIAIDETVAIPGCERFFIRDPDGNRIEILEWQKPYDPAMHGRYSA